MSHLKMDGWKTSFLLGWPIFRCYVSFREGNGSHFCKTRFNKLMTVVSLLLVFATVMVVRTNVSNGTLFWGFVLNPRVLSSPVQGCSNSFGDQRPPKEPLLSNVLGSIPKVNPTVRGTK